MSPGIQEAVALAIVVAIAGFALYRRWRKAKQKKVASCCDTPPAETGEKTVHFYRREDP